tara:strand:- start:1046 stop:1492 length:447 start_codon:yes stop_codon:yes gene_type:complete
MAASDFFSSARHVQLFPPTSVGSSTGFNVSAGEIDTLGFSWMRIVFVLGASSYTGDTVSVIQTSPTEGGAFTTVSGSIFTAPTGEGAVLTGLVDLGQVDRWLKVRGTGGSGGTSGLIAVYGELYGPGSTTDYINRTVGGADEFEFVVS